MKEKIVIFLAIVLLGGCLPDSSEKTVEKEPKIDEKEVEQEFESDSKPPKQLPVNLNEIDISKTLKDQYRSSNKYDLKIRKETNTYLPQVDWIFVKAQFFQESKMNPGAESGVGAGGIAQIMPSTWQDMKEEMDIPDSINRFNPDWSIKVGVYYNSKLWSYWKSERPHYHRVAFMDASYNAGAGSLTQAQKKCMEFTPEKNCNLYPPVINQLEKVTGQHHKETTHYVENIFSFWAAEKIY